MKKVLGILAGILLLIGLGLVAAYFYRKNQAAKQLVPSNSQALLSISLDDILLEHWNDLFKNWGRDSSADSSSWPSLADYWNAGLAHPAEIYFFTLAEHEGSLYSIQRITDSTKWRVFWAEHAPGSGYLQALADGEYVLFRLGMQKDERPDDDLQAILTNWQNWTAVANLKLPQPPSGADLCYQKVDGSLSLFATLHEQNIKLSGNWRLQQALAKDQLPGAREIPSAGQTFLSFRNAIPLTETPWIGAALYKLAGIDSLALQEAGVGYVDLFIAQQMTTQQDTVLVYDYDENFNSIEKQEVRKISVPLIESAWKGDERLRALLPDKLFYAFHKQYSHDGLLFLSTVQNDSLAATYTSESAPLHIQLNFAQVPAVWAKGAMETLRMKQVNLDLQGKLEEDGRELTLQGKLSYQD